MKTFTFIGAIAITIATTSVTTAVAADRVDLGKHEYDSYCVACHGNNLKGHGQREMPIWGKAYQIKAGEFYADDYYDPETFIRGRILALIDYINRMQAK